MTPVKRIMEAFEWLETSMKRRQRQDNADPVQLTYLRIRDM